MDYLKEADTIVRRVTQMARRSGKRTGFWIGNTRKVDHEGLYFSPIRDTSRMVAGSVIVYGVAEAIELARFLDGRVQYLLVDTEKKISREMYGPGDVGNVERAVRENVSRSAVLTYKGNDLSVDCIDALLAQMLSDPVRGMGSKRVAIIGAGNLACKLALKLVERGAHVTLARRNRDALTVIVKALNLIKPAETIAEVAGTTDNDEAARGADILIGMTAGQPVITASMIDSVPATAIVMDGGKGCLFPEAARRAEERGLNVLRVDVRAAFEGQVAMLLEIERNLKSGIGRKQVNGVSIVSGGLLARAGEVVVDNVHNPCLVFGVADGCGDFLRSPSPEQLDNVDAVRNFVSVQEVGAGNDSTDHQEVLC